jgi:hypothetical protein
MARKGLGKGLDSLFPDILNEDFDSNSAQSLEDMLKDEETVEEVVDDIESKEEESEGEEISQEAEEEDDSQDDKDSEIQEGTEVDDGSSEDLSGDEGSEESLPASQEIQIQEEHVDDVKKIVEKNPRITLWSSRSSAVLRYLRKTEPEFSISKEASILIEEAVSKKYPEIWELFKDL